MTVKKPVASVKASHSKPVSVGREWRSHKLNRLGGSAIGLCGMDGQLFQAVQMDEKYGLVGEITAVNTEPVETALLNGYIPVVSTVACPR